jgi:hypothetical protein
MKDKIIAGSVAGAVGGVFGLIFSYSLFLLGISPVSSINIAGSFVALDILNLTTGGIIWAIIVHFVVATIYGVMLIYFLLITGKDYWLVKGVLTGAAFCLIAHAYLLPLMRTDATVHSLIFNPPSFGTMTLAHTIIGMVSAYVIIRYAKWEAWG